MKAVSPRRVYREACRRDFGTFCFGAFEAVEGRELDPNWHIDAIAQRLQTLPEYKPRRLVLNVPPRALKSFIASIAWPAWLMGRDPCAKIICASYNEELSLKLSRVCRKLIESPFYTEIFPRFALNPLKRTEHEFETTDGGFRLATSVGGTATGRGGDVIIIDDPLKASEASSERALAEVNDWIATTALSRLDSQDKGMFVVLMQRLHENDLSGTLISKGWPSLVIPMIAKGGETYTLGAGRTHTRRPGELLQPSRDTAEAIATLRAQVGDSIFESQFQQNPLPALGNLIKRDWVCRYEGLPELQQCSRVVLSVDPGGKPGDTTDYTAIVVCGAAGSHKIKVLHVERGRWSMLEAKQRVCEVRRSWSPSAILVEESSWGLGILELLRQVADCALGRRPRADKIDRLLRHQGRFEAKNVELPSAASWLPDFERELFGFPNAKNDDQVDALTQALDYLRGDEPSVACDLPIILR